MNRSVVFMTLARAGIDPAKTFPGLRLTESPRLRAPTMKELLVLRVYIGSHLARDLVTHAAVGASSSFAPVFKGWNVWGVWQVDDLPLSLMGLGLSRDRQLQIWVEDHIRLEAPEAKVADPLDLKGSQVQILKGEPTGLKEAIRKEQVPGDPMILETQEKPPELRFIRFFNRGEASQLPWPYDTEDKAYLLDRVYQPDPGNEATKGTGPGTITDRNITEPAKEAGKAAIETTLIVALFGLLGYAAISALGSKSVRQE